MQEAVDTRPSRSAIGGRAGPLLTLLAGLLLLGALFSPWTSFMAAYVDGGEGTQTYSGWDLMVDCTSRAFPSQCVFEDHTISSEFVPDEVVAGDWVLVTGVLIAAIGVALMLARSRRTQGFVLVAGWLVAFGALIGGIVTVALLMDEFNGPPRPTLEYGVILAAVSPVVALVGLTLCTANRARIESSDE